MPTFATLLDAAVRRQKDDRFARSVDAFEHALAASEATRPVEVPACLRLLGLDRRATVAEARARFRALAKRAHPDAPGGSAQAFRDLAAAYAEASRLLDRKPIAA